MAPNHTSTNVGSTISTSILNAAHDVCQLLRSNMISREVCHHCVDTLIELRTNSISIRLSESDVYGCRVI